MEIDKTLRRAARNYAIEAANLAVLKHHDQDAWQEHFIHHFKSLTDPAYSGYPLPSAEWIERWAFVYGGEA